MVDIPSMLVINLERSTQRLRTFRDRNRHLQNVARMRAIEGANLDKSSLEAAGYIANDLSYGRGSLGCAMSHIKLWEMVVAENRSITVFEDDAITSHHFEEAAQEVLEAPAFDWDIILWGWGRGTNPEFAWVDLGFSKIRLDSFGEGDVTSFQSQRSKPTLHRLLFSFGGFAYSISPNGAAAALRHILPLRNRSVTLPKTGEKVDATTQDVALCDLYPKLSAFLCLPQLAVQSLDGSVREAADTA